MPNFKDELAKLINRFSKENECNTPDFILAKYLCACMESFNAAVNRRSLWYGEYKNIYQAGPVRVENSTDNAKKGE